MTAFNRTYWIGISLVLAFALTSPAHGQVYRCKDATGKLNFSDRPCDSGQSGTLIQRQRSQEAIQQERMEAAEAQFQKEVRRSMESPQTNQTPMRATAPVSPAVNQWACRKAKDNYQTAAGGMFRSVVFRILCHGSNLRVLPWPGLRSCRSSHTAGPAAGSGCCPER